MDQRNGYAVIDLETTGFGKYDRIVEIGVVLLDPNLNEEDRWRTLVQPMRDIPNGEVHIFPNCGHWTMIEARDAWVASVLAFLTRPEGK